MESNKSSNLGCLSTLILFALFFFVMSIVFILGTAMFNSDNLSGDNAEVGAMKVLGVILIVLYLIFRAKGGKWYKIRLDGYADEDKE